MGMRMESLNARPHLHFTLCLLFGPVAPLFAFRFLHLSFLFLPLLEGFSRSYLTQKRRLREN